ncbi:MAG TPA: lamin tail domain-containing protein [Verrucomicrobiales bacterium]|nr:lamin tail domain-containing protein [Verrucomicrobiales bacterium]
MKRLLLFLAGFILSLSCSLSAAPLPIEIKNPSFEENAAALAATPGSFTANVIPQWTATAAGLYNPNTPVAGAPNGIEVAYLNNGGVISQALVFPGGAAVTASPGALITLSMQARPRTLNQSSTLTLDVRVGAASISAATGTITIAANNTGYSAVSGTVTMGNAAKLGAASGQPVTLVISNSGDQANIDSLTATVAYPPVINSLAASVNPATAGQSITISWNVAGATSLTFNGANVTGTTSTVITAPAIPTSYPFTATNEDGTTNSAIFIDVTPAQLPYLADVTITEVLTDNTSGLKDEDGEYQDWIELFNATGQAVNLNGWKLTDDSTVPDKWLLPAVSIPPSGYLVIFASGKDRRAPASPLHTNFKLDTDGEYLSLRDAAGNFKSEFNTLPKLPPNVSYGYGNGQDLDGSFRTVSDASAPVKWLVPAGPVSDAWRGGSEPFDETGWTSGMGDLGFDRNAYTAYAIAQGTPGIQNYNGALGLDFNVVRQIEVMQIGCFDHNSDGIAAGVTITAQIWRRNAAPDLVDLDSVTAGVQSSITFTAASGGTLVGGQRFKTLAAPITLPPGSYTVVAYGYGATELNGNTNGTVQFPVTTNGASGAVAFVGGGRYGTAGSFPATTDAGPPARYGAGTFIFREQGGAPVATDTSAAMLGVNASLMARKKFEITTLPVCPVLRVTYDDGFVAWINGVEVGRRNAPASLTHTSTATGPGSATAELNLAGFPGLFHIGINVLAVHGMNVTAADQDFRLSMDIRGQDTENGVALYFPSPTPGAGPGTGILAPHPVITEIHYDPVDSKSKFTEFVEIYNPLNANLDLSGWRLDGGLAYTFPPGTTLPACGYLVVGESPAHIETWLNFPGALGPWTGSLKNEGDTVELRDASGNMVDRVPYEPGFPWPTVGDFPGPSIQRMHPGEDGTMGATWRSGAPTPGASATAVANFPPPAIRQVVHTPEAPLSGQPVTVTAKVTDRRGLAGVWLEYQIVEPGNYIRLTDPAWNTSWTSLIMHDDGADGDVLANDFVFSVVIPGSVQVHRRLIRYRIRAWDSTLSAVRVPYADDDCPNFAYFCYDGVPAWSGAVRPGVTSVDTFNTATMSKVRAWHLLSNATDVQNCQYGAAFNDGTYRFEGALVIGGKVYDHMHYRVKGQNSTFNTGKNKWKLQFNRGRYLEMPNDYGTSSTTVRTLNLSSVPCPWAPWNRGLSGLDEAVAFRLSNLAGAPAPNTSYVQWRVIDGVVETNAANQYDGDLWGLYLAFENTDNNFKDAHGLPDGNIFRLQVTGAGNSVLGQGKGQPGDLSDLNAFTSTTTGYRLGGGSATVAPLVSAIQPESWFRANLNLLEYFNWRAVTEAVNQTDRREQENVVYYRDPTDNRWQIFPWDVDLLYENFDRWGPQATQNANNLNQYEQMARALIHPAILTEFQNRARELQDLLLNSDQSWKVVDEFVSIITDETPRIIPNGGAINDGFVEVERRRWDYNPVNPTPPRGAGPTGNYYKTPYPIGNQGNGPFPQPYNRVLASADFEGMVKWVKDFIATGPYGGGRLAKMANGEVNPYTLGAAAAIQIPATPTITYGGPPGYPLNQLSFISGGFSSPNGQTFTAMQWRIGEIYDPSVTGFTAGQPWRYEIENVWTSGEVLAYTAAAQPFPAAPLSAGHTYRARVRHKDSLGRWSHWSTPVEFTAGTAIPGNLTTDLVISEIMYNPPEGNDLEYIELMNINASAPLDISGITFTAGVEFAFPAGTVTLAPGERAMLVGDTAAFTAKYGAAPRVLGAFSGNLSNGGEQITLSLGQTTILRDVTYSDSIPWPSSPDGSGASLVLISPTSNPDHANPLNWRTSPTPNPGSTDATTYAAWKTANNQPDDLADTDHDGLPAFLEYSLGSNPSIPSLTGLPAFTPQPDGSILLTLTRPLTNDDAALEIQSASDLTAWFPADATLIARSSTQTTQTLTFSIPADAALNRRYLRTRFFTNP